MATNIDLPCSATDVGDQRINKVPETVTFRVTGGSCIFRSFNFIGSVDGFSEPTFYPDFRSVSYAYDGTSIPTGYGFSYVTTDPDKGNGSGVIKNK